MVIWPVEIRRVLWASIRILKTAVLAMFLRVSWNAYIAAVMLTQRVTCEVGKWPLSRLHDGLIIIKKVNEENTVLFSETGICKEDGALWSALPCIGHREIQRTRHVGTLSFKLGSQGECQGTPTKQGEAYKLLAEKFRCLDQQHQYMFLCCFF